MLGWALSRNAAKVDAPAADDTQLEQPDTPAPVFAARALKTVLFGTPAPSNRNPRGRDAPDSQPSQDANGAKAELKSPSRPQSILMTPGTATGRRKRVSFGHDVKDNLVGLDAAGTVSGTSQEERLQPRFGAKSSDSQEKPRKSDQVPGSFGQELGSDAVASQQVAGQTQEDDDDDCPVDADTDITVDLNEPRSGSGKYWKSSFETYHAEAKVEMEKLVKYKQLAKSYAKMKDAEALQVNQRLEEEREKVSQMEKKVTELAREMLLKKKATTGGFDKDLMDKLTKQTTLTSQYQAQVRELEALLAEAEQTTGGHSLDTGGHRRRLASPRTQKTLMETQRELRRARTGLKEQAALRDQVERLKAESAVAQERLGQLAGENERLSRDLKRSTSKLHDVEKRLERAEAETVQKGVELKTLRAEHDKLKASAKARFVEAEEVLRKKNEKIAHLKEELANQKDAAHLEEKPWQAKLRELSLQMEASRRGERLHRASSSELADEPNLATNSIRQQLDGLKTRPLLSGSSSEAKKENLPTVSSAPAPHPLSRRSSGHHRAKAANTDEDVPGWRREAVLSDRVNQPPPAPAVPDALPLEPSDYAIARRRTTRTATNARARKISVEQPVAISTDWRPSSVDSDMPSVDLLGGQFDPLGGSGDVRTRGVLRSTNNSKADLPPDRLAAAIARLEMKRAERMKAQLAPGRDKENVAPIV